MATTRVKCLGQGDNTYISPGSVYEVLEEGPHHYRIVNNEGRKFDYPKELFSVITEPTSAFATQVGGSHYRDMKIQPIAYIMANQIPFPEGNVIKYVSRWRKKAGLQDLKKARHMLDTIIEAVEAGEYA